MGVGTKPVVESNDPAVGRYDKAGVAGYDRPFPHSAGCKSGRKSYFPIREGDAAP